MSNHVIQTNGLTRYFGNMCAVDQVSLSVPRGSVYAFLGRNGSGKSTLVRMILGLLGPTRGSSTVLGEDSQKLSPATRGRLAYVAEGHPLFDWMRVEQLEHFQKKFYPDWDGHIFGKVVEHFDLDRKAKAATLSRGQRAGLSLALALAGRPELLVMDDPALGLDPVARRTLLETMILVTRDAGHTIFFTSHILDDVERVADHIAILDRSVLRVACPVEVFHARTRRFMLEFAQQPPSISMLPGLLEAQRQGKVVRVTVANFHEETEKSITALGAVSVVEHPLTLEDAVIAYLGRRGETTSLLAEIETAGVSR
jgi:ABC-2 type transport system ATP-binding protein